MLFATSNHIHAALTYTHPTHSHSHTHPHAHTHTHTHTQVPTWLLKEVALAQADQPLPGPGSLASIQLPPPTNKVAESAQPPPARAFAATPGHVTNHMTKLPGGDSPCRKQSISIGDSPLTSDSSTPTSPISPPITSDETPASRKTSISKVKVEPIRMPKRLSSASSIGHIPQSNHGNKTNDSKLTNVKTNPLHLRKSHSNVDVASRTRGVSKQSSLTKLRTSAGRNTASASTKPGVSRNITLTKKSGDEKSTKSKLASNQKAGPSEPSLEAIKNVKTPDTDDETPPTSPLKGKESHDHLSSSSDGEV